MLSVVLADPVTPQAATAHVVAAVLHQVLVVEGDAVARVSANAAPLALAPALDEVVHGVVLASGLGSFTVEAVRGHCAAGLALSERVLV